MRSPSQRELLDTWERGAGQGPVVRALTLLSLALPDRPWDRLGTISVGGRDRALLMLREAAFGKRLSGMAQCARCGERLEFDCANADLLTREPDETPIALDAGSYKLVLRLPNSIDLIEAAKAAPADAQLVLLARCITEARNNGDAVAASNLPASVVADAARRLAEADPQADMHLTLRCPVCASDSSAAFDIGAFLWAELEALAQRLLSDVHALATAYGWSEREILDLSPPRRQSYLAMVRG